VSTARQEEERTIEVQLGTLRDFAREHGYTIVKEYIDDGWSGDILARPSLDQLREDAKKKMWQAVLIYDPDRLARRYSYQELVMDELRDMGLEVMFITVPSPKNSEEKILHGVRGLFAEYERAKIRERFRLGKVRKVKEGHVLLSEAPYGYAYVARQSDRHGFLEIDPDEARVVQTLFDWVGNKGLTLRQVVRRLQEQGIRPRRSERGVWNTSTLSTLLRNSVYIGEAHWGSSHAVAPKHPIKTGTYRKIKKTSRILMPKEEWIIIPVPVIIERDLFERTRAQLATNYALCKRNKKNPYLLAGKIRCACGRTRSGEGPLKGRHLYYRCTDRVLRYPLPPECRERGLNARIADELVWQRMVQLMSSPELMRQQVERRMGSLESTASRPVDDITAIEREVDKLKEQASRYNAAYGAGVFTLEQLRECVMPLNDKIKGLEAQITETQQQRQAMEADVPPTADDIERFANQAGQKLHDLNFEQKRAIVVNTVEKVVGTQQQLQVFGYISIPDHVEFNTINRHGQCATRHFSPRRIPFDFMIEMPPPLRRGVDYGFLHGTNVSQSAAGSARAA
ncbi:MAG: recombinase family protein, partial [Rhodoplanes sp.]